MGKKKFKILIGISCVVVLALVVGLALYLDSQSDDPIFGIFRPDSDFTRPDDIGPINPVPGVPVIPPEELPPTVEIPVLTFPCKIPSHGLTIERIAPYTGLFVEDGTNIQVENVAMLLVTNTGKQSVEYTQICIRYGEETLLFDVSALPVGERIVVQEKYCKPIPQGDATSATALVIYRPDMAVTNDKVSVVDNGDNTLTITNLTEETIPTVRVFYKYYMENEDVFVGGIAFTVRLTRLAAGASITIQPTHYNSTTSRVVMTQTYDSEV